MDTSLKQEWLSAFDGIQNHDSQQLNQVFDLICKHYDQESQRFYHKLSHIRALFNFFNQFKTQLHYPQVCSHAIWFHDVIYDPKRNDNEDKSVELYISIAKDLNIVCYFKINSQLKPEELVGRVTHFIDCTKNHKVKPFPNSEHEDKKLTQDLELFLDFDVSILGADQSEYDEYAINIRKEYIHYEESAYKQGRTKVLKSLMEHGVFKTKTFQDLFEKRAIENMSREIEQLAK